jgi:hypothetical protein
MDIFQSLAAARLIFILGVLNLVLGVAVFFTCRCLPGSRIGARLTRYGAYRRLFKGHCYMWWAFWPSVIVHSVFAIGFLGWPG